MHTKTSYYTGSFKDFCHKKHDYSFHFNGQETDNEIAGKGNINTAQFWEYDARSGRRWNVDPKTLPYLSTYSCFSNNPTLYVDPKGDIFKLGKDKDGKVSEKSKTDVKSLAENKDNQKYITFDNDGKVGLDFGNMSNEERDKLLAGDKGLNLINKLATATGKDANGNVKDLVFVYEVSDNSSGINREDNKTIVEYNYDTKKGKGPVVVNLSITPKFLNAGVDENLLKTAPPFQNELPINGVDGYVRISPGCFESGTGPKIALNRASIVYHELMENYLRTVDKLPYYYVDKSKQGAHKKSSNSEGNSYQNPTPGSVGVFYHD